MNLKLTLPVLAAIIGFAVIFILNNQKIDSFEECVSAGNPVMESYPRQCRTNGKTFIEKIDENQEEEVYCTLEARQCPDGSYVGRVPPDCKFAPCPN